MVIVARQGRDIRGLDRVTGQQRWASDVRLEDRSQIGVARDPPPWSARPWSSPQESNSSRSTVRTVPNYGGPLAWIIPLATTAWWSGEMATTSPRSTAATGRKLWSAPGVPSYGEIWALGDGSVYVLSRGDGPGGPVVVAYDLHSGAERWRFIPSALLFGEPMAGGKDVMFVGWEVVAGAVSSRRADTVDVPASTRGAGMDDGPDHEPPLRVHLRRRFRTDRLSKGPTMVVQHDSSSTRRFGKVMGFRSPRGDARVNLDAYDATLALSPAPLESRQVGTAFGTTHVAIAGRDDAPPLILLHGKQCSSTMWLDLLPTFTKTHRTYMIDAIGELGRSSTTRMLHGQRDIVAWLSETLDRLNVDRCAIVGLSNGCYQGSTFAMARPERVERLAMLAPAAVVSGIQLSWWRKAMATFGTRSREVRSLLARPLREPNAITTAAAIRRAGAGRLHVHALRDVGRVAAESTEPSSSPH